MEFVLEKINQLEKLLESKYFTIEDLHLYAKYYGHCEELILFLREILRIIELKTNSLESFQHVASCFLEPNSPFQLNISRNARVRNIDEKNFYEEIKPAIRETMKLIEENLIRDLFSKDQAFIINLRNKSLNVRNLDDWDKLSFKSPSYKEIIDGLSTSSDLNSSTLSGSLNLSKNLDETQTK